MMTKDPESPESKLVAGMHAQWIKVHWGEKAYSPEAHVSLAEGYLTDPRFVEYYDGSCGAGAKMCIRDRCERGAVEYAVGEVATLKGDVNEKRTGEVAAKKLAI